MNSHIWYYNIDDNIEIKLNSNEDLSLIDTDDKSLFGFIYLIENLTNGRKYIGKKQLKSVRRIKKGKKELAQMLDKRGSKYKIVEKYTDWLKYTGSNEELNKDISNGHIIKKTILEFVYDKRTLTYLETKYLFLYNVLEDYIFYNSNILGKFYKKL